MPPPPGTSTDLPPGYTTREQRDRQKRKQRRKGRVGVMVGGLILVVCVVATLALTAQQNQPDMLSDVEEGECFRGEELNDVEIVSCSDPHRGELVALLAPADPDAAYPGEEALHVEQDEACALRAEEYFGGPRASLQALDPQLQIFPVVPSEDQWNDDQKDTFCYVGPNEQGDNISGSIEGEGAAVTTTVPPG